MRALIAAAALALPGVAAADDDLQVWGAVTAAGKVRGELYLHLEAQGRFTENLTRDGQWLFRPAAGWAFAPDANVLAGYVYVATRPEGRNATREHRVFQQLAVPLLRGGDGKVRLSSRTRLEQRMLEGADETGWRARQQLRLVLPVGARALQAVLHTEGFFNLNATDFGARTGVDQWRTFAGVSFPVGEKLRLEPGYLNQRVFQRGENANNHIANVTLNIAL